MNPEKTKSVDALLATLFRELFQTEQSAERQCRREADRLGATGPSGAMRAVAQHAAAVLQELPGLSRAEHLPVSRFGQLVGAALSRARDLITDRLIEEERSYRSTLLGIRHGVDLVTMIRHVADSVGRVEIGGFCTRWLAARQPMVAAVEQQLAWFAHHPDVAAIRGGRRLPVEQPAPTQAPPPN